MKFKTEVNLDFISGDEYGDADVNAEISNAVINSITGLVFDRFKNSILEKVEARILKRMDVEINKFIKKQMKSKLKVSDDYDAEETTLDKFFKRKIDKSLGEKVDSDGFSRGSYNDYTRFEVITGKVIDKKINDLVKKMAGDINSRIQKQFSENIKEQIAENFTQNIMKNLDVNKMLTGSI